MSGAENSTQMILGLFSEASVSLSTAQWPPALRWRPECRSHTETRELGDTLTTESRPEVISAISRLISLCNIKDFDEIISTEALGVIILPSGNRKNVCFADIIGENILELI